MPLPSLEAELEGQSGGGGVSRNFRGWTQRRQSGEEVPQLLPSLHLRLMFMGKAAWEM